MASPTEQFSQLSLNDMRFAASDLRQRKRRVRAVLASFDRDLVPSRYRPDIFERIDEEQSQRPSSEWVIGDDILGSLMQKGCHDPLTYGVLTDLEPAGVRVRKFGQKINRLLRREIQRYDREVPAVAEKSLRRRLVLEIAGDILALSRSAHDDLDSDLERDLHNDQENAADVLNNLTQALISVLRDVCSRDEDPYNSSTRRRRLSGGEGEISLYHCLIHSPPRQLDGPDFIIRALQKIGSLAPVTFKDADTRRKLRHIHGSLLAKGAPRVYRDELWGLS
ncbi:hypothetical protein LTR84_003569 [Exophiala bonariae]|uniref:Uncharacterized protein n=1 Tax=Exophiala bonariae TaxID=1690606 RepID=A0AAV9N896_9EURO|nr:hypothetical protein LTR84_003569 [Exophiala bonariae]